GFVLDLGRENFGLDGFDEAGQRLVGLLVRSANRAPRAVDPQGLERLLGTMLVRRFEPECGAHHAGGRARSAETRLQRSVSTERARGSRELFRRVRHVQALGAHGLAVAGNFVEWT